LTELDTTEIRAKCARFALDAGASIARFEKIRGEGLNDRAADTFDPLYVIARHAGEEWEKKLHAAALALNSTAQSENAGVELLLDILSIFVESDRDKIFSRDLAATLRSESGEFKTLAIRASSIDEFGLAKLLRPYGIKPVTLRIGQRINRGYGVADFREALRRYVPEAEIEARREDMKHRIQLHTEAQAEAEKESSQDLANVMAMPPAVGSEQNVART
jgi:hypothetical protein